MAHDCAVVIAEAKVGSGPEGWEPAEGVAAAFVAYAASAASVGAAAEDESQEEVLAFERRGAEVTEETVGCALPLRSPLKSSSLVFGLPRTELC